MTSYIISLVVIFLCAGFAQSKEEAMGALAIAAGIIGYLAWRTIT